MSSSEASVASMRKWGIPEQRRKAPELTLLERLVWVRYKSQWWPALLYHSYSELQAHLYDKLDTVLKAQFAIAIMRQMQEKRKIMVARLLGRTILEVLEVDKEGCCEFYWQLPNVLPTACKPGRFRNDTELYLDFHRALDQAEDIIREVSQNKFALLPNSDQRTWLQRAKATLDEGSSLFILSPPSYSGNSRSSTIDTSDVGVWDNMMSSISRSFDAILYPEGVPEETIATRSHSKDRPGGNSSSKTDRMRGEGSYASAMEEVERSSKYQYSGSSMTKRASKSKSGTTSSSSKHVPKEPSEHQRSVKSSTPYQDMSSKSTKTKLSERTNKTDNRSSTRNSFSATSPVGNEMRDPPTGTGTTSSSAGTPSSSSCVIKSSTQNNASKKYVHDDADSATRTTATNTTATSTSATKSTKSKSKGLLTEDEKEIQQLAAGLAAIPRDRPPVDILPGLEGDDIVAGLSAQVETAHDIWKDCLRRMSLTKKEPTATKSLKMIQNNNNNHNEDDLKLVDEDRESGHGEAGVAAPYKRRSSTTTTTTTSGGGHPSSQIVDIREDERDSAFSHRGMVDALAARSSPAEEAELAIQKATDNLSFWQRMVSCNPTI